MSQVFNFSFKAMGSPCSVQFLADSPAQADSVYRVVVDRIAELEQRYSRYREDSLISEINRQSGTGVRTLLDSETYGLLQYADHCYRESGQLFDVTSGVLRQLWGMDRTEVPNKNDIKAILRLIGWKKVQWDETSIYLPHMGMQLDFGGIVKEYAADTAAQLFVRHGINSGIVELGGDIRVIGPLPDGRGWPVAIRDPRQRDKVIARFELASGALATSGDYERFQLIDGVSYSHILNPKTGWPVSGLRAVSVVANHCVVAGSVATIAMLKANKGLNWLRTLGLPFLCGQNDGRILNKL
ncbi:MAG: FAD:protein FMN transferase [Gammaproteobacteria bacterium]